MNPAFTAAYQGGENLAQAREEYSDKSALDNILSRALASNDPEVYQQSIGAILSKVSPAKQGAALQVLNQRAQYLDKNRQEGLNRERTNKAYKELGLPEGEQYLPPAVQAQREKTRGYEKQFKNIVNPDLSQQTPPLGVSQQPLSRYKNLTDDQLIELSNIPAYAQGAKEELKSRQVEIKEDVKKTKETRRQFESDRTYHSKISDPIVEAANASLKEEPVKKGLNAQLRKDIASGNTSGFFPFLVDKMGIESFRNPESARFTSEIKNKFVSSLADIPGARPNMFIERVLSTAQPQLGRSQEANLSVLDLNDFVDDLDFERARQIRNIAKEDRKELGYVRNDVVERAEERMGNYANKRQEQMAYDIRRRHEDAIEDDADLLSEIIGKNIPEGTPVTRRTMRLLMIKNKDDPKKAVAEAKKLGMVFPLKEVYERYED